MRTLPADCGLKPRTPTGSIQTDTLQTQRQSESIIGRGERIIRSVLRINGCQGRERQERCGDTEELRPMTRPGLTGIDHCPVQNLRTARLPNLDRTRHTDFRKNMNSEIL